MNEVKDIMSIIKFNGKYMIYFPYIAPNKPIENRICKWWGSYNTFNECFEVLTKQTEYKHLVIDNKLLRRLKIDKILNE